MSSFLSAAENVARQLQNIRRNLKKKKGGSRTIEVALKGHNLFLVKMFLLK